MDLNLSHQLLSILQDELNKLKGIDTTFLKGLKRELLQLGIDTNICNGYLSYNTIHTPTVDYTSFYDAVLQKLKDSLDVNIPELQEFINFVKSHQRGQKKFRTTQINLLSEQSYTPPHTNPIFSFLLGQGSICWTIAVAIIPILFNLNIQEYYVQSTELNNSAHKVEGTVLHSMYARDTFDYGQISEVVEIHYHYVVNHKNFTGWSYVNNWYYPYGKKVKVLFNKENPKVSRVAEGSYLECDGTIINLSGLVLVFILLGFYRFYTKPAITIKMSRLKLSSSILFLRISIIFCSATICNYYSIRDILFDIFLPISLPIFVIFCFVTTVVWHYTDQNPSH